MNDEKDIITNNGFVIKNVEIKSDEPLKVYTGIVIFFGTSKKDGSRSTKSYGFIEWYDNGTQQRDIFVHFSDIIAEEGVYRTLKKGQKVEFQVGVNNYNEPKAVNVKVIG